MVHNSVIYTLHDAVTRSIDKNVQINRFTEIKEKMVVKYKNQESRCYNKNINLISNYKFNEKWQQ